MTARRHPRRVYEVGEEPDPRFTFANERTFLAWIRTALALVAGGLALQMFADALPAGDRTVLAVVIIGLGIACSLFAYRRWAASERALRLRQPLPALSLAPLAAAAVGVVAAAAAALAVFRG